MDAPRNADGPVLNCADYGDATSRKRFFLIAVKRGCGKIRWPKPTHAEVPGHGLKRWRGVDECLDYADMGHSIFDPKYPLVQNTLRRVAVGMKKYNGMDFLMVLRLAYCLQNGLPLDQNVYDLASWSCLCELSEKSVRNHSTPMEIPAR